MDRSRQVTQAPDGRTRCGLSEAGRAVLARPDRAPARRAVALGQARHGGGAGLTTA